MDVFFKFFIHFFAKLYSGEYRDKAPWVIVCGSLCREINLLSSGQHQCSGQLPVYPEAEVQPQGRRKSVDT